jgi:hypothetical protein
MGFRKKTWPTASPQSLGSSQVEVHHQRHDGCLEKAESISLIRPHTGLASVL